MSQMSQLMPTGAGDGLTDQGQVKKVGFMTYKILWSLLHSMYVW